MGAGFVSGVARWSDREEILCPIPSSQFPIGGIAVALNRSSASIKSNSIGLLPRAIPLPAKVASQNRKCGCCGVIRRCAFSLSRGPNVCRSREGCDFAENEPAGNGAPLAFWRAAVDSAVLVAQSDRAAANDDDAFDLMGLSYPTNVLRTGDGIEHVVIGDGRHRIRLELHGNSVTNGPVHLRYDLDGFSQAEPAVRTLRRFLALQRLGRFPETLFPVDRIVARRVRALQAYDGQRAGASQREIASVVLGERLFRGSNDNFDSIRKRVSRLLDLAEQRMEVAYRRFFED